jgi:putative hydrolase of HD superfamily
MTKLNTFRVIYKLKSVNRYASVDNRKESSAEHSWSSLILADYIITKSKINIDRLKVYELLMYQDLMKIYSGDTPIDPTIKDQHEIEIQKTHRERTAFHKLIIELPESLSEKYKLLYSEYTDYKSLESRFVRAIGQLDAELHDMDYKQDWKGWTEKFLRDKKTKYYKEFPLIMELFEEFLKYSNENEFFNQE